jgi:hypothetical protein
LKHEFLLVIFRYSALTSQKICCTFIVKTNCLMLLTEEIDIYSEIHTKQLNTLREKTHNFVMLKQVEYTDNTTL